MSDHIQRERSRSPRRRSSRSPPRRTRRSYSPRSRSRSRGERDEYRRSERLLPEQQLDPQAQALLSVDAVDIPPARFEDRTVAKENMMQTVRDSSQQDRRVYVGNLSYDVKWHHLKDFMRQAGEVLFADVLLLPNGMSKDCGICNQGPSTERCEYAQQPELDGSPCLRPTVNPSPVSLVVPHAVISAPVPEVDSVVASEAPPGAGGVRQIYVSNLPFNVGWQDLKDLFRSAAQQGAVIRADVHTDPTGRPKGSGIVAFDLTDMIGRVFVKIVSLVVAPASVVAVALVVALAVVAALAVPWAVEALLVAEALVADSLDVAASVVPLAATVVTPVDLTMVLLLFHLDPPNPFTDYATSNGEKSAVIYVRNLPWSTCNEDLIDLFSTIGKVERAEIQYEPNGRSRGTGVVQFDTPDTAETAIAKFSGYQYGGRPLGITFVKYMNAGPAPEEMMEGQESTVGLTQDQIM
ncbi:hypothetical protein N7530_003467 [Penicillium desertorum]|uniref:RRM domain-containing protein n=1 Tax=Penicillium desertorum TaxID=1303715 RepID=A0A9W9WWC7_9EURO|nr:hypothetical protein N7530_003467 [Penicillium desertorum]